MLQLHLGFPRVSRYPLMSQPTVDLDARAGRRPTQACLTHMSHVAQLSLALSSRPCFWENSAMMKWAFLVTCEPPSQRSGNQCMQRTCVQVVS